MRSITCDNHLGSVITFGEESFSPFVLAHVDGLYKSENNVYMSQNTMVDGGTYQGSTAKIRNIVLVIQDKPATRYAQNSRDILYALFPKDTKGTLTYSENGSDRIIDYVVESVYQGEANKRQYFVSLLCEDPLFRSPYDVVVEMSNWVDGFEFIHEFVEEGEEIGGRNAVQLRNIIVDDTADRVGITIKIYAEGNAVNPMITRVESDTHMKIGSTQKPFALQYGDLVTITTGKNNKHIYLLRNGVQQEVNAYLTEDSDYIQLLRGNNNIGYEAESGEENLVVEVSYTARFEGA